jgi:hypothetical protein
MDLTDVIVVHARSWETEDHEHPGDCKANDIMIDHAISPFEVQPPERHGTEWRATLYARAPDHAWARREIDFTTGSEYLIELHRAAELEVMLRNYVLPGTAPGPELEAAVDETMKRFLAAGPDQLANGVKPDADQMRQQIRARFMETGLPDGKRPRPVLRVRDAIERVHGGPVKVEVTPSRAAPTRLGDLPPGNYVVAVEIGNWWDDPLVLGNAQVQLVAGQRTSITLELKDLPSAGAPVPLSGTLYLPPAWGNLSPSIAFEILERPDLKGERNLQVKFSEMQSVEGSPGLYRWNAGLVPPGRYEASLPLFDMQLVIEVPPEGQHEARIVIGEPAELRVRVVDAETGLDAEVEDVHWNVERPAPISGGFLEKAAFDPATMTYGLRAPAGRVEVQICERKYRFVDGVVTLQPGHNEHTIRLNRACGIELSLREGDTYGRMARAYARWSAR